jgi:hypothetical protein
MSNQSTVLRFIKANNPDSLTEIVGALPFKIEIKQIVKDGKEWICFFTLPDEKKKISNDLISEISNAS